MPLSTNFFSSILCFAFPAIVSLPEARGQGPFDEDVSASLKERKCRSMVVDWPAITNSEDDTVTAFGMFSASWPSNSANTAPRPTGASAIRSQRIATGLRLCWRCWLAAARARSSFCWPALAGCLPPRCLKAPRSYLRSEATCLRS
ncbi:hypothetical protein IWZ01DRAFT_280820 [Phyllosticta capitalensis]